MTNPSDGLQRASHAPSTLVPSGEAVVEMAAVGVRRGTKELLQDIHWQVREGERWIIMGPNGAGKSTLMQVASTRMHPTTGMVGILDEVLGAVDVFELRPRIGLSSATLAQQLPGQETVLDAVVTASWGVMGRWNEDYDAQDEERARRLIWQWGLSGYEDRRFGTLSEGERKRVLVARSLMTDPELLLLDEPAAGLDLAGRETLVRALTRLAADPAAPTLVLVTHHVEEIPPGFTHALLMRQGRVVAAGPLEQTLTEDNLSAAFGLPLKVTRDEGRYTAVAR
ncbi:iron complex transport system ATP-binding protein [Micrococcus sp. TA1]|nr:iron complex transport system ATP-binding protein [Micrococcus sp. TA1]